MAPSHCVLDCFKILIIHFVTGVAREMHRAGDGAHTVAAGIRHAGGATRGVARTNHESPRGLAIP